MVQIYLLNTEKSEQTVRTVTKYAGFMNKPCFTITRYYSSIEIRMITNKVVELDDFLSGKDLSGRNIDSYLNQKFPECYYTVRLSHCSNFECSPETPNDARENLEQNINYNLRLNYYYCDSDKFGYAYELDYADEIFVNSPFTVSQIDNVAPVIAEKKERIIYPFEYAITDPLEEGNWDNISWEYG